MSNHLLSFFSSWLIIILYHTFCLSFLFFYFGPLYIYIWISIRSHRFFIVVHDCPPRFSHYCRCCASVPSTSPATTIGHTCEVDVKMKLIRPQQFWSESEMSILGYYIAGLLNRHFLFLEPLFYFLDHSSFFSSSFLRSAYRNRRVA